MEMEDKESTESGSPGRNSDSESPPSSGGAFVGHGGGAGGGGIPGVMSMVVDMGVEKTEGVMSTSAVALGGDLAGGSGVTGGGVIGGGVVGDGGNGELTTSGKKKRGRPRKYDENGNLRPSYIKSPQVPALQPGLTLSTPPSYEYSSGSKRGRGKALCSANRQILASLGELFANTAGGDFTPHVVNVYTGEGRFEILTLTGSYTISENGKMKSQTGGLSVSLASPDGRVIGGGVAGSLMAANPIQVVVGSFVPNVMKMRKTKHNSEPRVAPIITPAIPISQAPPKNDTYPMPTTQLPMQIQGIVDNPNSASADTPDWNGSGPSFDHQKLYPDINISVPFDEH